MFFSCPVTQQNFLEPGKNKNKKINQIRFLSALSGCKYSNECVGKKNVVMI
jgi:hypothetical protein